MLLIFPFLGLEYRVIDEHYVFVFQSHVMRSAALVRKRMFQPVDIITLLVVGTVMSAPALGTCQRTVYRRFSAVEQEAQLNCLDQLSIERFTLVLQLHLLIGILQSVDRIECVTQASFAALN